MVKPKNNKKTQATPAAAPVAETQTAELELKPAPQAPIEDDLDEDDGPIDLSKVNMPEMGGLSNRELLQTIINLSADRAKENPVAPHVGVNELAAYLAEHTQHKVDGKIIRRKLQKIRKKGDYTPGKTGEVQVAAGTVANPLDTPVIIQWVNRDDRTKGIEYLVTVPTPKK